MPRDGFPVGINLTKLLCGNLAWCLREDSSRIDRAQTARLSKESRVTSSISATLSLVREVESKLRVERRFSSFRASQFNTKHPHMRFL